jgi:hypothetical protein
MKRGGLEEQGHQALLGAAGRAIGGGAASTGGASRALELSADGKGEGGHDSSHFLALTFGTSDLF